MQWLEYRLWKFCQLHFASKLQRAECVITKTYKISQFADELSSYLDKSDRNVKLLTTTGQIVFYSIETCQLLHCADMPKFAVWTNQVVSV